MSDNTAAEALDAALDEVTGRAQREVICPRILAALDRAGWALVRKQATGKAEPAPTFEAAPANVTQMAPKRT
jgi:hypothetical protein